MQAISYRIGLQREDKCSSTGLPVKMPVRRHVRIVVPPFLTTANGLIVRRYLLEDVAALPRRRNRRTRPADTHDRGIDGIRPRKLGSHWTLRWRKRDSNPRSPVKEKRRER